MKRTMEPEPERQQQTTERVQAQLGQEEQRLAPEQPTKR
jgi:hypothetical protein